MIPLHVRDETISLETKVSFALLSAYLIISSSDCSLTLMSSKTHVCIPNFRFSSNRSYQLPGLHESV